MRNLSKRSSGSPLSSLPLVRAFTNDVRLFLSRAEACFRILTSCSIDKPFLSWSWDNFSASTSDNAGISVGTASLLLLGTGFFGMTSTEVNLTPFLLVRVCEDSLSLLELLDSALVEGGLESGFGSIIRNHVSHCVLPFVVIRQTHVIFTR